MSRTVERSIEIQAPVTSVYNQWTQFETFPEFFEEVREVRQIDEKRVHWLVSIGGHEVSWNAAIVEQMPDTRILWRCSECPIEGGSVHFSSKAASTQLEMSVVLRSEALSEAEVAGWLDAGLARFKQLLESHPSPTAGWRREIHGGQLEHPPLETIDRRRRDR